VELFGDGVELEGAAVGGVMILAGGGDDGAGEGVFEAGLAEVLAGVGVGGIDAGEAEESGGVGGDVVADVTVGDVGGEELGDEAEDEGLIDLGGLELVVFAVCGGEDAGGAELGAGEFVCVGEVGGAILCPGGA
jgi:hypothetical protein